MPEFLADPSVLTKEKLKSELIANNVSLPGGEQRKDVYVQLYLQHLTVRNVPGVPAQPDFSSDEEREPTPVAVRNRGGGSGATVAVGRKATKKTDKSRLEQDDIDIAELNNEELKDQLLRYGVNPGPIVATTRKLYEKKLLKLKEPSQELSSFITTPTFSSSTENNKQNGNDDSDQFSDSEEDPKTEFRLDKQEPLKSKTKTSLSLKQRRIAENNQDGITETFWRSGSSKSGLLQAVSRESARVSRRTPRKRVETTVPFPVHDPVISENTPIAVVASSNETLQVVNRVPGNTKHADPILSISDFSELPRRTPKKPLMTAEVVEKMSTEVTRLERDILKEMFPYEASTPTGISGLVGEINLLPYSRIIKAFFFFYSPRCLLQFLPSVEKHETSLNSGIQVPRTWILPLRMKHRSLPGQTPRSDLRLTLQLPSVSSCRELKVHRDLNRCGGKAGVASTMSGARL